MIMLLVWVLQVLGLTLSFLLGVVFEGAEAE